MRPWAQVALLAKRELLERARSKPFIITMSLLAVAILAIGPVVSRLSGGDESATEIGLAGEQVPGIEQELQSQAALFEMEIEIKHLPTRSDAEIALTEGEVAVVLVDGTEIVFHTDVSSRLTALVHGAVVTAVKTGVLAELGLSESEIAVVVEPIPVETSTLEESKPQDDARRGAAFGGAILLYVSIIMFGQFVAMGTVEEKQNRVVEVILSRVKPWQVLVGKVVGIGFLGLLQLLILAGAAYVSAQMADLPDIDVAAIGLPIIASLFFWFILGYTFYAFLYAAVGSTVSRQEDLQGAIMIPIVLIMPGYILAIVAAENPDALIPTVASWLPPWAPFVMPVRIAAGVVQPWEIVVAVVGTALGAIALVWIGSRVYSGALLRTGSKIKLREAWKAAVE
ncbi:MAG: ABC transporter permease [Actinomycetota bacterium]|nr:ABC transporter permease [Actinomycetota bacterium]